MQDSIEAARETIRQQIQQHEATIKKLRAADATLAELADGGMTIGAVSVGTSRPISLADAVRKALAAGPAPSFEVVQWVKEHYDATTKDNSIRGTLAYLKNKGQVGRGGKNWYLVEKESPADE